jgi:hypothetical protein
LDVVNNCDSEELVKILDDSDKILDSLRSIMVQLSLDRYADSHPYYSDEIKEFA